MITLPQTPKQLREYFITHNIDDVFQELDTPALSTNQLISDIPYRPELDDLYRLHKIVIETKRTTILEFGCGWSTYVLASALNENRTTFSHEVATLRRNNPFEIHSVDNEPKFISIAKSRIPSHFNNVFFYETDVEMTTFDGRVCTEYSNLPLISPDFIYLDAPDQFGSPHKLL